MTARKFVPDFDLGVILAASAGPDAGPTSRCACRTISTRSALAR